MYKNCPIIVALVGFVILLTGIICSWYAFPKLVEHEISKRIALVEGSQIFEFWKKPPFPLKFRVYFFNVTNPSQVQQGAKPIFTEMGPYVFDEYWERENVSVNEEADTIEYMIKRTFFYNQEDTGCRSIDDVVTMVNAALVISATEVSALLPSAMDTINEAVPYLYKGTKDAFLRASIRDILFDGILITCHDPEIDFLCGAAKSMLPPSIKTVNNGMDFKISLFGLINSTLIGPFVMGRGLKNTIRGDIMSYQDETEIDMWPEDVCNMINGSDSTLFPQMKKPAEKIYVFSPDFCRSVFASFEKYHQHKGIPVWKYSNTPDVFSNGPNNCFCPIAKDENFEEVINCPPQGLYSLATCTKAPVLISNPHFYLADPALLKYARGLKPQKHLHETFMFFEPTTATPLFGARRVQMSIQLKRFEEITLLNNVSEGVCPLLWAEEIAAIPEELTDQLVSAFHKLGVLDSFKWALIIIGILCMLSSFVLVIYRERLMCFAHVYFKKGGAVDAVANNRLSLVEPISNANFNNTVLYPSLYPQMYDKNVHDRLVRRNNLNGKNAWQFNN